MLLNLSARNNIGNKFMNIKITKNCAAVLRILLVLLLVCFSCFLLSCSGKTLETELEELPLGENIEAVSDLTADNLFDKAVDQYQKNLYTLAIKSFKRYITYFPTDKNIDFAVAQLADSYFQNKLYREAGRVSAKYLSERPSSSEADFLAYLAAKSSRKLYRGTGRDVSPLISTVDFYKIIVKDFPNSDYRDEAKSQIVEIHAEIADYYKYIINYYDKRQNYEARDARSEEFREYLKKHDLGIRELKGEKENIFINNKILKKAISLKQGLINKIKRNQD